MFDSTFTHDEHKYDPTSAKGTAENPWSREDMGTDAFKNSPSTTPPAPVTLSEPEKEAALEAALAAKQNPTTPEPTKEYPDTWHGRQKKESDDRIANIQAMINKGKE